MRYSQLSTFGKVGCVLWWISLPIAFGLAGNHGGWLGAAIGSGSALMILRLMRDLERQAWRIERLHKAREPFFRIRKGGVNTSPPMGAKPPPPPPPQRKLDITIQHDKPPR